MNDKYLNIFLYWFVDRRELDENFDDQFIKALNRNYTDLEKNGIIDSMKWALNNKHVNFRAKLPDIELSNEEILIKLSSILKKI